MKPKQRDNSPPRRAACREVKSWRRAWAFVVLVLGWLASTSQARGEEWRFRVFLDDSEIGYHNFQLTTEAESDQKITTDARFEVSVLFFNAYTYEHTNTERWTGDCLTRIDSRTNDNGTRYSVQGRLESGRFSIRTAQGRANLPPCVMTFAYWNPRFLQARRLLNAQTGEHLAVAVQPAIKEQITVRGESVKAHRYRVVAEGLEIDLWYSADEQWLALESLTESGRKLRYELN